MNPETIIAELRRINAWRRGDDEISAPAPGYFGDVLDAAADSLASLIASNTTLRRERNAANDLHGTARGANAELADELASVSGRLSGAELERDKLRARVKELDELYRDLSVAYEQNAHQCVKLNRELGQETTEWLNGATIQRERAEKAEARVKELEAEIRRLEHENDWLERRRQYETDLVCAAVLEANARGVSFGSAELCSRVDELRAIRAANAELKQSLATEALAEAAKCAVSNWLLATLSGADKSLRTDDGFIRWGLVERKIHEAIDAASKEVQP